MLWCCRSVAVISILVMKLTVPQTFALMVTQLGNASSLRSPAVYAILLGMTCVSSLAGVANDHLLKTTRTSLHAQNMVLYLFGVGINLLVFVCESFRSQDTRGFLTGYDSVGAIALIVLNACLGLVITAVYKYSDAIVKGIATTVTTAILVVVSSIFFGAPMSLTAMIGVAAVFVTSYTYIKAGLQPLSDRPALTKHTLFGCILLGTLLTTILATCAVYGVPRAEVTSAPSEYCYRQPLPTTPAFFNGTRERHDFDDVLMIVFWNKPLYRHNLESFAEAYSPHFPNMVFVGPRSQQEPNEAPYPEVLVDTFEEPGGMAGRVCTDPLERV